MLVELRDVRDDDLPAFFAHQADPEAARMAAFRSREREAFTSHWAKIRSHGTAVTRTVLAGGAVAGYVGSFTQSGERLVAYWIGREWWGRGIATLALTAFLRLDQTRPLRARVVRPNIGSIRVLQKCGFARCGSRMDGDVEELVFELT